MFHRRGEYVDAKLSVSMYKRLCMFTTFNYATYSRGCLTLINSYRLVNDILRNFLTLNNGYTYLDI